MYNVETYTIMIILKRAKNQSLTELQKGGLWSFH